MKTIDYYLQMETHELFDILACVPNWQTRFATLREAAEYAKALPEYYDYMTTDEGARRRLQFETVPDVVAQNRAERLMRERMSRRPSRAAPYVQDNTVEEDTQDE
jgi:hypothetical protein